MKNNQITRINNQFVILDRDIASRLGLETKRFLERCKRNETLFQNDDYFQLSKENYDALRSQLATLEGKGKHSKYLPFCFTKSGVDILKTLFKKDDQIIIISELLDDFNDKENDSPFQESKFKSGLVTYTSDDGKVQFDVQFDGDTVWVTQQQMAELFDTSRENITLHIGNIFDEKELEKNRTCKDFLLVQIEGQRQVNRPTVHYNLDIIISVGYRVKSIRGTQFRQWATTVIRYLKGFLQKNV